ncbi:MAG: N-acetylmuramoyl-L-alanine amidase [Alphaproteobacteria bacterium]|nr:N-acetylmuramoyl-L-alanine amidase [Alphaproteobacteria bacterium]
MPSPPRSPDPRCFAPIRPASPPAWPSRRLSLWPIRHGIADHVTPAAHSNPCISLRRCYKNRAQLPELMGGRSTVQDDPRISRSRIDRRTVLTGMAALAFSATCLPVPASATPRPPRKPVVVIDAGHGGHDPGTIGVSGTNEKDVTLLAARELYRQLQATGLYRPALTRSGDLFLALGERVDRARDVGGELFISLHADAIHRPDVRGASVYTLSEVASDAQAAALAQKENRADLLAGVNLAHQSREVSRILIDLMQRETKNRSAVFASGLVPELSRHIALLSGTHRFAGFTVLTAPDIPSVLLEMGYLSNRQDEQLLRSPAHRARVAQATVRAVGRYFAQKEFLRPL